MANTIVSGDYTQPGYNPSEHLWMKATLDSSAAVGPGGYPQNYYFADSMRALSVAFGQKFSDVFVIREDEKGYPRKVIQVPIKFGARAKSHDFRTELESAQIDENGVVDPKYYIQNPSMTWKFTNGQYDGQRQTSSNTIRTFYDRYLMSKGVELEYCDLLWQDIMVIPVTMGIQLTCYADKDADLQRMFEQVMRKTKDSIFFLYVKEFWFMNIRRDIKVKLSSFNFDYGNDDMGEDAKREVKVTFDFQCEAFIYREIEKSDIITQIIATLNPHINETSCARVGVSGNMYMHEKYTNSAEYAEAAKNHMFEGSLINEYKFLDDDHIVGPEYKCVSSYFVPYDNIDKYVKQYSADYTNICASAEIFCYEPIPNTVREYNFDDTRTTSKIYVYGSDISGADIISGGQIIHTSASPICIRTDRVVEQPWKRLAKNHYEYRHKYLEDSKQNIINAVYGVSHDSMLPSATKV